MRGTNPDRRAKRIAGGLSILMLGAVLRPIVENWRRTPTDSFPLSYYPMFSARRTRHTTVIYVVGVDGDGTRHLVPYRYAGSGGLNQVRRQLRRMVKGGNAATLCQNIAARIARETTEPYSRMVLVQIVSGVYRLDEYFNGNTNPVSEQVHASCAIRKDSV